VAVGAEIFLLLMTVVAGRAFQARIVGVVRVPRPAGGLPSQLLVGTVAGKAGGEADIAWFGITVTARAGEPRGNVLVRQTSGFSSLWLGYREAPYKEPGRDHSHPDQSLLLRH
jgi:hypothetical protein